MDADIRIALCIKHEKLLGIPSRASRIQRASGWSSRTKILAGERATTSCGNGRRSMPRPIAIYKTMLAIVHFVPSF